MDLEDKNAEEELLLGDGSEERVPRDIKCADAVFDIGFHPTNNYLVTGRVSGVVEVYEYKRNDTRLIQSMKMHEGSVRGLEFSEDGNYLVTVGSDRRIKVFDCNAQKTIIDIGDGNADSNSNKSGGGDAVFDDDAAIKKTKRSGANTISAAEVLKKRKAAQQQQQATVQNPHEAPISSINICSETLVATGDDEGQIVIWDMRTATPAHKYQEHGDYVSQMLYFSEVDQLVSTSGDTCLACYSLKGGKILDISTPRKDELNSMVFIGATNDIVCGTPSGRLPIWRYGAWQRPFDVHATHPKDGDGLVPYNDNIFFTGANDGTVRVVQHYPTRSLLTHLGGGDKRSFPITRIRISHDRNMIAYCGEERYVRFEDIEFLSSEAELDKLRTRAEQRHMSTLRKVNEANSAAAYDKFNDNDSVRANAGDDDNDANWHDANDDDDDDESEDSAWTSSDDDDDDDDSDSDSDDNAPRKRPRQQQQQQQKGEGNNNDDDDDYQSEQTNRRAKIRGERQKAAVDQDKDITKQNNNGNSAATIDKDDLLYEPVLTRQEKRERVAAAKWLKEAQKTKVNFRKEKGKKRVRGFWSGLTEQ